MKNKPIHQTYLESIANEILAKYRRLDTILSHAPTKGSYHENIIRDVVRDYLPNSFSTGEGFFINSNSETSSQMDILIVDNLDPRSFIFKEASFYIATNIAVACFGEIKTQCSKKEFVNSFQNLIKSSQIMGGDNSARATSFIFCYDAYASQDSFKKWVDEAIATLPNREGTNSWNYPDYIFCLKKKVMLEKRPIPGGFQYWHSTPSNSKSTIIEQKIIQDLNQCISNGCGRIRKLQNINLLEK